MDISIAVGALSFYPTRATLTMAGKAGASLIEMLLTQSMLRRGAGHYAEMAARSGVSIASVHAPLALFGETSRRKIESDRSAVRFASGLDACRVVVLHPPLTGPRDTSGLHDWLDAIVSERDASRTDLRLAIENRSENHDGTEPQLLDDLDRLRAIAGEWEVHVTLDIAHAYSHGVSPRDAVEALLPRLANVHFSDAFERRTHGGIRSGLLRDHRVPGTGVLPLADALDALAKAEYNGVVTLELSPLSLRAWWPPLAQHILTDAIASVRQELQALDHSWANREQPGRTA